MSEYEDYEYYEQTEEEFMLRTRRMFQVLHDKALDKLAAQYEGIGMLPCIARLKADYELQKSYAEALGEKYECRHDFKHPMPRVRQTWRRQVYDCPACSSIIVVERHGKWVEADIPVPNAEPMVYCNSDSVMPSVSEIEIRRACVWVEATK